MVLWQLLLYTLSAWMYYSLLAIGFGFTLRSIKFFNFSYGGAFLVGGYMAFLFYRVLEFPFLVSVLFALGASGLYLVLAYKFIFSILLRRQSRTLMSLIASFGLLAATSAALGMIFGNQITLGARKLSDIYTVNVFGATLNLVQVVAILCFPIILAAFWYVRYKTRLGRSMRAVEDDMEVAELVGISKEKTFLKIFFLSGVLAGLAVIAEVFDLGMTPASGLLIMLPTIVATVIGGMPSFWGAVIGGFILAVSQQITVVFFGGSWVAAVPFVVLIIMLFIRPEGILKR